VPRRFLIGLAAVMFVLRDPDVQDTHAEEVRERWERVDWHSPDSVLAFVQGVLAKQMEWSREEIDLRAVAPTSLASSWNSRTRAAARDESCFGQSVVPEEGTTVR